MKLIIIRGAPGSGKSSLGRRLRKFYPDGVLIEVDNIRGMMNNVNWKDEVEYLNAIDVVVASTKAFLELKRSPVILVDQFMPDKLNLFLEKFTGMNYEIITLIVENEVLQKRLEGRKEGFKNYRMGTLLNNLIQQNPVENELVIDTSAISKDEIAGKSRKFLERNKN